LQFSLTEDSAGWYSSSLSFDSSSYSSSLSFNFFFFLDCSIFPSFCRDCSIFPSFCGDSLIFPLLISDVTLLPDFWVGEVIGFGFLGLFLGFETLQFSLTEDSAGWYSSSLSFDSSSYSSSLSFNFFFFLDCSIFPSFCRDCSIFPSFCGDGADGAASIFLFFSIRFSRNFFTDILLLNFSPSGLNQYLSTTPAWQPPPFLATDLTVHPGGSPFIKSLVSHRASFPFPCPAYFAVEDFLCGADLGLAAIVVAVFSSAGSGITSTVGGMISLSRGTSPIAFLSSFCVVNRAWYLPIVTCDLPDFIIESLYSFINLSKRDDLSLVSAFLRSVSSTLSAVEFFDEFELSVIGYFVVLTSRWASSCVICGNPTSSLILLYKMILASIEDIVGKLWSHFTNYFVLL